MNVRKKKTPKKKNSHLDKSHILSLFILTIALCTQNSCDIAVYKSPNWETYEYTINWIDLINFISGGVLERSNILCVTC